MHNRHMDGLVVQCALADQRRFDLLAVRRNIDNDCEPLTGEDADNVLHHVARLSAARSTVLTIDKGRATVEALSES
jgi:hypothetical protein